MTTDDLAAVICVCSDVACVCEQTFGEEDLDEAVEARLVWWQFALWVERGTA